VHCPVDGILRCIPQDNVCNGHAECDNSEDEFECGECAKLEERKEN